VSPGGIIRLTMESRLLPYLFLFVFIIKSLNRDTNDRIHDAQLLKTWNNKPLILLPHKKFTTKEYFDDLQSIAAIIGVVTEKDDMILNEESDLSGSSNSEFLCRPTRIRKCIKAS
jgi:hypothetical protein